MQTQPNPDYFDRLYRRKQSRRFSLPKCTHHSEVARDGLWPAILQIGPLRPLHASRPSGMGRSAPLRKHQRRTFPIIEFCPEQGWQRSQGFWGRMASSGRGVKRHLAPFFTQPQRLFNLRRHTMSNQPAHKIRLGLTTATIWNNDGAYSVDITRSYKNGEGEWKSTSGFFHSDLLNVAKCAERAEIWISRQTSTRQ